MERIPRKTQAVERDGQAARRAARKWSTPERWATWLVEQCALDDGAKNFIAVIGAVLAFVPHVGIFLPVAIPAAILAARLTGEGVRVVADLAIDSK